MTVIESDAQRFSAFLIAATRELHRHGIVDASQALELTKAYIHATLQAEAYARAIKEHGPFTGPRLVSE